MPSRSLPVLIRSSLLIIAAVTAILGPPLFWELFLAIPWTYRKLMGWCVLLALFGWALRRLLRDPWRSPGPPPPASSWHERAAPWLLALLIASLAIPMLRRPDGLGFGDWDYYLANYEAIRKSIVEYGQFPWWNPWRRGGFPLAVNPQCGVFGIATPIVLLFGTTIGLGLATVVCMVLAAEGARRLARYAIGDPWASVLAGLVYGINGGVLVSAAAGYYIVMCYMALPWIIHHGLRLGERRRDGWLLGGWLALNLLNGINYITFYAWFVLIAVWLWVIAAKETRARAAWGTVTAIGVVLALAGWRLAMIAALYRDFPRHHRSLSDESLTSALRYLIARPGPDVLDRMTVPAFWETVCYVGPLVPILALISLRWAWRWPHWLGLIAGWLALGTYRLHHLSYWLADLPLFSSMHAATRWRFVMALGLGLAAAITIARWRSTDQRWLRGLGLAAVLIVAADYWSYGRLILPTGLGIAPTEARFPGPPVDRIESVQMGLSYAATLRGYGTIQTSEPLLGYDFAAPSLRTWRGHPEDAGEFSIAGRVIEPKFWSPNRIVIAGPPGAVVTVNQNPGSWRHADGKPLFPDMRCVEPLRRFEVTIDADGETVLTIRPRGLAFSAVPHSVGLILLLLALMFDRSVPGRPVTS